MNQECMLETWKVDRQIGKALFINLRPLYVTDMRWKSVPNFRQWVCPMSFYL